MTQTVNRRYTKMLYSTIVVKEKRIRKKNNNARVNQSLGNNRV